MIYTITGRRELGKTTLARYLAASSRPTIVIDPRAQWLIEDDRVEPYDSVDAGSMLNDLEEGIDVVLRPDDPMQDEIDRMAVIVKERIRSNPTQKISIVLDECGLYRLSAWGWIMRCSPRQLTTIALTAHRPQDISTDIRALVDHWCIFRTTQSHDLEAIEERCGERTKAIVQTLDRFQFVEWNDARGEIRLHRDGSKWRTPRPLDGGERDRVNDLFEVP